MQQQRKSYAEINKIYFFTASIHKFKHLLIEEGNQDLIVNYLIELSTRELVKVFGFVVMPHHIHIIWQQLQKNGKETPQGSFLKYTAHELLKKLKIAGRASEYSVIAANKKHEIWQRDPVSIEVYSRAVANQKLNYIHANPVNKGWQLAKNDLEYKYSSARFYETGKDDFGFLHNLFQEFDGE